MDEVILELVKNTKERSRSLDEELKAPPADTIDTYTAWLRSELRELPEASVERFQRRCTMLLRDVKDNPVICDKIYCKAEIILK